LIPALNPAKVVTDLVAAVGEGVNNALALAHPSAPPTVRPATHAARARTAKRAETVERGSPKPADRAKHSDRKHRPKVTVTEPSSAAAQSGESPTEAKMTTQ
jgi:hypothetical protein